MANFDYSAALKANLDMFPEGDETHIVVPDDDTSAPLPEGEQYDDAFAMLRKWAKTEEEEADEVVEEEVVKPKKEAEAEGEDEGDDEQPVTLTRAQWKAFVEQTLLKQDEPAAEPQQQKSPVPELEFELTQEVYEKAMESYEDFKDMMERQAQSLFQQFYREVNPIIYNNMISFNDNMQLTTKFFQENPEMELIPQDKVQAEMQRVMVNNPGITAEDTLKQVKAKLGPIAKIIQSTMVKQSKKQEQKNNSAFAGRGTNPRAPESRANQQRNEYAVGIGSSQRSLADIVFAKGGK